MKSLKSREFRVLITSIGSSTAINVIKMLKKHGDGLHQLVLYGTDIFEKKQSAGASLVDAFFQVPMVSSGDMYNKTILSIISDANINCVIPIHDSEIEAISSLAEDFPSLTFWAVNSKLIVNICNDKVLSNRFVSNLSLKIPNEYSSAALRKQENIIYPLIGKPRRGISSRNHFLIRDFKDAEYFLEKYSIDEYIVQSYIEDNVEYTVDCYSNYEGKFIGAVARERTETKAGVSMKGRTKYIPELIESSKMILNRLKYKGASNIQFLFDGKNFIFIEINPRFAGGGILSYVSGLNSPILTVLEAMGHIPDEINLENDIRYEIQMTRYLTEVFYDAESHNF